MRLISLVVFAMILSGCVNNPEREAVRYTSMSKEQALSLTRVHDDGFEKVAEVNTQEVFQEKRGIVGITWDDNFLRAYIDKSSGITTYQVYDIIYMKDWSYYNRVNYNVLDGVDSKKLLRISSDVESCSSNAFIGCTLREDVGWGVDRELLDQIAATYKSASDQAAWSYKLKAQQGEDRVRAFTAAEVAAFLEKVDDYKLKHSLPMEAPIKSNIKPLDPNEREFGKRSITAEKFARQNGCIGSDGATAQGFMIIKDYDVETYQFACDSGDLLVRCDTAGCEKL